MIRVKVKEVAEQKGISMSRLARLADVNMSTIQKIYRTPTNMNFTIFTLDKLATALGVDASELIESVRDEKASD